MIELKIKEHCKNCPNFEVKQESYYGTGLVMHCLTCSNESVCTRIKEYLESIKKDDVTNG